MNCGGLISSYCPRNTHGKAGNKQRRRHQCVAQQLLAFFYMKFKKKGQHSSIFMVLKLFKNVFLAVSLKFFLQSRSHVTLGMNYGSAEILNNLVMSLMQPGRIIDITAACAAVI